MADNQILPTPSVQDGHRAGFVNIVGSPNVGKSTLMNRLVGERLSIINAKAQTTRHRIMGLVNDDEYQIVYSDTPGVLDPAYKLQEGMMKFVKTALQDADILLLVTDVNEREMAHPETMEKIAAMEVPTFVLVNKIDLASDQSAVEKKLDEWAAQLPRASIVPIMIEIIFSRDFGTIIFTMPCFHFRFHGLVLSFSPTEVLGSS